MDQKRQKAAFQLMMITWYPSLNNHTLITSKPTDKIVKYLVIWGTSKITQSVALADKLEELRRWILLKNFIITSVRDHPHYIDCHIPKKKKMDPKYYGMLQSVKITCNLLDKYIRYMALPSYLPLIWYLALVPIWWSILTN